jgi:hypothetical protein
MTGAKHVQCFNSELYTQIGKGEYLKSIASGTNGTGWKPILLYAVAPMRFGLFFDMIEHFIRCYVTFQL